ncbi:MAG TPA: galactosylceramidase [Terriglobia bacterium]|nr:galactosylceramidase [Terriglobia bacterium]
MMGTKRTLPILLAATLFTPFCSKLRRSAPQQIRVDGSSRGRVFEGIGAVSAGASSRLLIDYPDPARSQILDYLFKPYYGASLQHLKVEVGSDTNSTDGSEPSHMRSRTDANFDRGYEWWLMEQAQARNPSIILDSLPWGAPGWIGGGHFYSPDMANYMASFVEGAKKAHGLDVRYAGVWNETRYDIGYVELLKKTFLKHGLATQVVCCDLYPGERQWSIISDMKAHPQFKNAIDVAGVHYPRRNGQVTTPSDAKNIGKPLWSTEDQPPFGPGGAISQRNWNDGGKGWAHILNDNYISGRFTKTEIWSPVTSYYDILAAPNSGLMYANTPWSGHYQVQSTIWVTAHTTQFAQPGWRYLDSACGSLSGKGTYVTLRSPSTDDYSMVLETIGAKEPQNVRIEISPGLSRRQVHVWETNATRRFERVADITPKSGEYDLRLDPDALYSVTTTTGQHKGDATAPAAAPFPFPYQENFDKTTLHRSPRYFADQDGAFEALPCMSRPGRCLQQVVTHRPISWGRLSPHPFSLLGSEDWKDYQVETDALLASPGYVSLIGRIDSANYFLNKKSGTSRWPSGYVFRAYQDGQWELDSTSYTSPDKKLAAGSVRFGLKAWHHLSLSFRGDQIRAMLDGHLLARVQDTSHQQGMVAVGSGWNLAQFDNFQVR